MRSSSSGLATFLMFLALAAMAVVGVFGVPQFPPVDGSPRDAIDDDLPDDFTSSSRSQAGESAAQSVEDLFAAVETPGDERLSPDDEAFPAIETDRTNAATANEKRIVDLLAAAEEPEFQSQPAAKSSATAGSLPGSDSDGQPLDAATAIAGTDTSRSQLEPHNTELDSRFGRESNANATPASFRTGTHGEPLNRARTPAARPSVRTAAVDGDPAVVRMADSGRDDADGASGNRLTWRAAVDRLRALGISHYRLAPGTAPNGFHFSCFFSPGGDPRITQRFEAEANEPLGAVEEVLAQVDGWRRQQTESQASRTAPQVAGPIESNTIANRSMGRD